MKNFIYLFSDPSGAPRYVGQSSRGNIRLKNHRDAVLAKKSDGSWRYNTYLYRWIRLLWSRDEDYGTKILEEVESADKLNAAEIKWISYYRGIGALLTNLTDGGDGLKNPSDEVRNKMRNSAFKDRARPERQIQLRQYAMARVQDKKWMDENRKRASRQWADPATRANMSKIKLEVVKDPAVLIRLSRGHDGKAIIDDLGNIYFSQAEAARQLNVTSAAVCLTMKGKLKTCSGRKLQFLASSVGVSQ